jgi:hypothetical protein
MDRLTAAGRPSANVAGKKAIALGPKQNGEPGCGAFESEDSEELA